MGTIGTWIDILVTNPATNSYALTGLTITAPSTWLLAGCDWFSNAFSSCSESDSVGGSAQWGSATGVPIAPGGSTQVAIWVQAPAPVAPATYPFTGTFTSTAQDASNLAFYAGPSFQIEVIDPTTTVSISAIPTTFVAGSAPFTVTATVSDSANTAQTGLTINWFLDVSNGYDAGTFSLTASSVTSVSGHNGVATATFAPSYVEGDIAAVYAVIGTCDNFGCESPDTNNVLTVPGAPATVAFLYNNGADSFPSTYYISGMNGANNFNVPTFTGAKTMAEIASGAQVGVSVADHFANPIDFATVGLTVSTITLQALSGAGGWDNGGTALVTTISCTTPAGAVSCAGPTEGQMTLNYFQGYAYATIGKLQATITGTYGSSPFTVGGSSGNIFTSAEAVAMTAGVLPATVLAGKSATVFANLTASQQPGVPTTLALCKSGGVHCATDTSGYGGANSGFGSPGGAQITAGSSSFPAGVGHTSTTSSFAASYYVDTKAGHVGSFNATASDPDNADPTNVLGWVTSAPGETVTTTAGVAATLVVIFYYKSTTPGPSADPTGATIVAGLIVYPDISLADKYGNPVTNMEPYQAQISLTPSSGTLSATTVYINSGGTDTFSSFGAIAYFTPSSAAVGTVLTITGSGVVNGFPVSGQGSLTVVSPIPTFSITSPTAQIGNVIYTNNAATVFHGWANASTGYDPAAPTNIQSIGYKINGGHWLSASFTPSNEVQFAIAAFLNPGLNTVQFNATDNVGPNTFVSSTYQVLVHSAAPTIKFSKTTTFAFGTVLPVTINDVEGDLNLTSVSAWFGSHNLNVTSANIVGTNTLGANSTFTLNLSNIATGTWTLKVSASDYAGNSVVATETVTVTVAFPQSVIYQSNSASWTTVGAYKGVLASWTNAWGTAQSLVIYAKLTNSSGSYVLSGSASIGSGSTVQVFCPNTSLHLDAGTYTLSLLAVTTANNPVSILTTINNFVVS